MEVITVGSFLASVGRLVLGRLESQRRHFETQERRAVERKIFEFFSAVPVNQGFQTDLIARDVGHSRELVHDVLIELRKQGMIHQLSGYWYSGPERIM